MDISIIQYPPPHINLRFGEVNIFLLACQGVKVVLPLLHFQKRLELRVCFIYILGKQNKWCASVRIYPTLTNKVTLKKKMRHFK